MHNDVGRRYVCVQSFNHLLLYADDRLKIKELEGVSAMRVNLFT